MNRTVFALTTIFAAATLASIASATPIEYTAGHADIRPVYQNGEMALKYRFDTAAVLDGVTNPSPTLHNPQEAYVRVPDSVIIEPSSFLYFSFFPDFFQDLGSPTEPFWVLPQNNVPGQPFFGFSTEELVFLDWGSTFEVALTNFSGPSHFALYQDGFGPAVKLSTADGVDSFVFPKGHDHFNWVFLEAGIYELELTITGTHLTDGMKSAVGNFTFAVGDATVVPEPNAICLAMLGAVGLRSFARRRYLPQG